MENSKQLQADFEKTATKVSMISIIGNSLLSIFNTLPTSGQSLNIFNVSEPKSNI